MATLRVEPIDELKEKRAIERLLKIMIEEKINFPTAEKILKRTKKIMEHLDKEGAR